MENIRPIKTDEDYRWALSEVERYFDAEPDVGTPDGDRFDVLSTLIDAYEAQNWSIPNPKDPITFLQAYMEDSGHTRRDLIDLLGSGSRASEVLSRKRALTKEMIVKLVSEWKLPAEPLLMEYTLDQTTLRRRRTITRDHRPSSRRKDAA